MIDQNRLSELRNDIGDDSIAEIIQLFCDEIEQAFAQLDSTDRNTAAEALHFIKGSALNIGLVQVGQLCERAEAQLLNESHFNVSATDIKRAYSAARKFLMDSLTNN